MDARLAEFIGIFIGDGSLNVREEKHSYEFKFTGNINDEIPYFDNHVSKLASHALGRMVCTKFLDGGRSVGLYFCSKKLAGCFARLGLTPGPKAATVAIPDSIMGNRELFISCLRGIFDTDGCFTLKKKKRYPVVTLATKSTKLVLQVQVLLAKLGIGCCVSLNISYYDVRTGKVYSKHYLSINGRGNTEKWFGIIGSNNPKTVKKYQDYLAGRKK